MARNLLEHWQCQTCFQHFPSDKALYKHIDAFQSRARHLFAELQKCFAHSDPRLSDEEDSAFDDHDNADNLANDCEGQEGLLCPHEECDGKPKTSFKTWKALVRHYTIHVPCREVCGFCGLDIDRVRKYVTHFDICKAKKEGQQYPEFRSKERDATERRMILRKRASRALKLQRSTTANTAVEEFLSPEVSCRKGAREIADADPENLHQSQQRRTEEDNGGATVAISSGSSYQALGTEDGTTEIATPAHFGMASTDALIPTHRTMASLPSHCDEPQGEVLNARRKRRRVGSFPLSNGNRGFIVTPEAPAGVNLQADNARTLDSPFSQQSVRTIQGGAAGETRLGGANAQVACGMKIARMAEVDKLEIPLGGYLFERMKASRMRHQEEERRCMRFTDTVRLHVAYREGEDIKLEIWLCASIRNDVSQATISSAEGLRNILGNYLFEAMEASNWRKEQEKKGIYDFRGAFNISFLDEQSGSDCKVEVLLGSKMGLDFYQNAFP